MKTVTLVFSAVLLCFLACKITESDEDLTLRSSVASAKVTSQSTSQVSFVAKASWHNGCGRFSRADVTQSASSFFITIYGTQKKNAVCTQAFIEFDAPVTIQVPATGTYTFKFWRTDTTSFDTTFAVQ